MEVEVAWEVGALLGEGPAWLQDEGALRLVDIKAGKLHRYQPVTGARSSIEVGGKPSFVIPEAGGGMLVGSRNAVHRMEGERLGVRLAVFDMPDHNRTNDATVDGEGRIWFGTMDDDEAQPTGALYCLDRSGVHDLGGEAVVTNGPALSRDGRTLYHVDSGGLNEAALAEQPLAGALLAFAAPVPGNPLPSARIG
ncbi:MAG: SMP-30/gluconolactonase/LRE family protein [Novosphingobium sp.]